MDIYSKNIASKENPIICWWSGGVTSAVACKIALDIYGVDNCIVVFINTYNEHEDTYRFLSDCELWYSKEIIEISAIGAGRKYSCIQDVWHDYLSLSVAGGAICSSELKRNVRVEFQRKNPYSYQVFGFDCDEVKRANNLSKNYPVARPVYPLLLHGLSKKKCIKILKKNNIKIPEMYNLGFSNNNCFGTGCVRGGIGYWKKIQKEFPCMFRRMAILEHELTNLKGKPVTVLRDQSNEAKRSKTFNVFLCKHDDYLNYKCIDEMKGRKVEPLVECNGFCGIQGNLFS